MAKFLSQVYTSIRGKVGGIVYTKNQFAGLVARAFTAPTNPSSEFQEMIRSSFSEASIKWEAIGVDDRELWEAYAATLVYTGPHGEFKLPGRQVFISNLSFAQYLDAIGGSAIVVGEDAPSTAGFENVGVVQPAVYTPASSTGVSVSIGNPNLYDLAALVQRSVAWELTKKSFHGPWAPGASVGVDIPGDTTTLIDIETPTATAGKAIFVKVRCITAESPHRITNDYILRLIPVTNGP